LRLVATLVVRDERDIVGAQIAYHLNAGVDFVIATDHDSRDGTSEILGAFEREGCLRRISESGPVREELWRTRMARLAASEYGADWVINSDADEFWWPRQGGSLKDLLAAVPPRFGAIGAINRHFVPVADGSSPFYERMTVRVSPPVALHDPTSPWRPGGKVAHRADPKVTVFHAGYGVVGDGLVVIPDWYPLDNLHFPYRSVDQWVRKTTRRAFGDKSLGIYVKGHAARQGDRVDEVYARVEVDGATLTRGLETGLFVGDTRLRDALRALEDETGPAGFCLPDAPGVAARTCSTADRHDDAVVDMLAFQDATLVRLQRRVDALAGRSARLAAPDSP
jgi:hypothetical protein